jgi:hypothetical protein
MKSFKEWLKNVKGLSTLSRFNPKTDFNFQATTNPPQDSDTIDSEQYPTTLNPSSTLWKSAMSSLDSKRQAHKRNKR